MFHTCGADQKIFGLVQKFKHFICNCDLSMSKGLKCVLVSRAYFRINIVIKQSKCNTTKICYLQKELRKCFCLVKNLKVQTLLMKPYLVFNSFNYAKTSAR